MRRVMLSGAATLAAGLLLAGCVTTPGPVPGETVWIERSDASIQCEEGSGVALEVMEAQLTEAGIEVYDRRKGDDGMMYPAVCGAATGVTNEYLIAAEDLGQARALGFLQDGAAPQ